MLPIDISIIFILLLILLVIKKINNKFIENFSTLENETLDKAKKLSKESTNNAEKISSLDFQANDPTKLIETKKELSDSLIFPTKNEILGKKNKQIDTLFNNSDGKYVKYKNRECEFLDINKMSTCTYNNSSDINDCHINCAENCDDDPNCISFQYDRDTKSCKLSSSCYKGNINANSTRDVYFKRGATIPPLAKFNKRANKKCNEETKIKQNGTFNNQTLSQCAEKCLDNKNCISFEFKKKDGINQNVCNLTNKCHRFNYKDDIDKNTDVFMANNVIINKVDVNNKLEPPKDNKRKIPFRKKIQFFARGNYEHGHKHYGWVFLSNQNNLTPTNLKYDGQNDDYDSVKIPPHTRIDMNEHSYFRGRHSGWTTGKGGLGLPDLNKHHIKKNKVSSWKIRNTK